MPHELDKILISESQPDFESRLRQLRLKVMQAAAFSAIDDRLQLVRKIFCDVIQKGDEAVTKYTKEFDKADLRPDEFRVTREDLEKAHKEIDKDVLRSLRQAIENVRKYQSEIFIGREADLSGSTGIKYTPIEKVGICVPGASAPLPSTVIMTAVPALVAGVKGIAIVSPPRYEKSIHPVILAVCHELQIDEKYEGCCIEAYRIGGVQAVAALTFGTDTVPKVYKIVGPGNQWVQAAKREAFGYVDVNSIAGPSGVLIVANDRANPAWVAADILSQVEHGPGSGIVFTDSNELAEQVLEELIKQIEQLSRKKETYDCLREFCGIFVYKKMDGVVNAADDFASEHLEVQCGEQSRKIAKKIKNAGAIFIGDYSPVAVGDYWAGPSHTLPTGMTAKFFSALSANDFVKSTSIIEYDQKKLAESAEDIIRLAEVEGLDAHAKSIRIRQQDL